MALTAISAVALSLGTAAAQDFRKVERRLGGAVEAGEITLEQAKIMLDALRRSVRQGRRKDGDREMEARKRRYAELQRKIQAAVRAGKMSRADGEKKLIDARTRMFGQPRKNQDSKDFEKRKKRYMEFVQEIRAAVRAGKLSPEDAEKKIAGVRMEMFGRPRKEGGDLEARKKRYLEFQRQIKAAVDSGELSPEDAEKKLIEVRKRMFGGKKDARRRSR